MRRFSSVALLAVGLSLATTTAFAQDDNAQDDNADPGIEDDVSPPPSQPASPLPLPAQPYRNSDGAEVQYPPPMAVEPYSPAEGYVPAEPVPKKPPNKTTGALRTGVYGDGDQTWVWRALAALNIPIGRFTLSTTAAIDVISSASVDVRSSPALSKVDVITTASGRSSTSGGRMIDRRLAATMGGNWRDGGGHAIGGSIAYANERDYNSIGAGLNGSYDLFQRATTLLGGVSYTHNWIASALDSSFSQRSQDVGWTVGVAQVLSRNDALRLRYDGVAGMGYQASPYRAVRFGNWTGSDNGQQITFANTLGSAAGLAENVPELRIRHALVGEWVHAFTDIFGFWAQLRLGTDNWGVKNLTAAAELRVASTHLRFRLGYRFYIQSDADFYQTQYVLAPANYTYYTSDKELSHEVGHGGNLGLGIVVKQPSRPGGSRLILDFALNIVHYSYNFILLTSRTSGFADIGLTWEL